MNDVAQLKVLLAKIEAISTKYAGVAEKEQYDFNVFSILRKEHEEVGLHSAFLKALFDPRGGHGQGVWMLNRFLKKVGIDPLKDEANVQVVREYTKLRAINNGTERDSIDIYIRSGNRAVVIENKIYADDQPAQIERYVDLAKKENAAKIDVIYLTLAGHEPSTKSLGNIDKNAVKQASYKQNIDAWLSDCIKHMVRYPTTRESLVLYQRVVRKLTGASLNEEKTMEIAEHLIKSPEIFRLGLETMQAMDKAKQIAEINFWSDLNDAIQSEGVATRKKNSEFAQVINENQKPAQWYAITIPIGKLEQHPEQICFYVAVDWNIYYGFGIMSKSSNIINIEDIDGIIQDAFKVSKYEAIAWRYPQSESGCFDLKIDFKHFNDNAISLIDKTHRKSYVKQLAKEIRDAIWEGVAILKKRGNLIEEKTIWIDSAT